MVTQKKTGCCPENKTKQSPISVSFVKTTDDDTQGLIIYFILLNSYATFVTECEIVTLAKEKSHPINCNCFCPQIINIYDDFFFSRSHYSLQNRLQMKKKMEICPYEEAKLN